MTEPRTTVRVHLSEDEYEGAHFDVDASGEWEVPLAQVERWEAAQEAYWAMQKEIGALLDGRRAAASQSITGDRATEK